ncbi:UPF0481 protein At3g47200-like [Silene latifolia]|uniref:UPF0481 protein At3g47200-like n=1 Tax=Silene latifolia TaxID=37657 RepID=UPI003D778BAB
MSISVDLLQVLKAKLSETSNTTSKWSLYSLSVKLSDLDSDHPFHPCIVSIGIAHYGNPRVIHMQPQKWVYMNSLLSRTHLSSSTNVVSAAIDETKNALLESCVDAISDLEDEARRYFGGAAEGLDSPSLLEVLILDGCFILELLIRYFSLFESNITQENGLFKPVEDLDLNEDPILMFSWIRAAVRRDLVLLENQIPYMVLQKLFEMVTGRDTSLPHDFLVPMVIEFFHSSYLDKPPVPVIERGLHRSHLLNLLLNLYRPTAEREMLDPPRRPTSARRTFLLNATSLAQVGVKFKNQTHASSLLDIRFSMGVFEIPTLHISKWSDSYFRNFIAFERCCPDRKPYMASYLELMSRLITGPEDVQLLERRGILINDLGSDEEIIVMFNRIGRQFDQPDYFYYQELYDLVDSSYNTMWNLYKSQLQYQYFRSPWAVISMLTAMLLVFCTLIQTVYTTLYYYQGIPRR